MELEMFGLMGGQEEDSPEAKEGRKRILHTMLTDPAYPNGWRSLEVMCNATGASEEYTKGLLIELGARASLNGKPIWKLEE